MSLKHFTCFFTDECLKMKLLQQVPSGSRSSRGHANDVGFEQDGSIFVVHEIAHPGSRLDVIEVHGS